MGQLLEVRWHARGGQGAKTAALLLAEAAAKAGKYIQGFPEYGPERMGAPILAFNRLSDEPIRVHSHVEEPDVVVVLDPTLIGSANITAGLRENGKVLVNTAKSPAEVKKRLKLTTQQVYTVDASKIALETLGKDIPNTPMMGALIRVSNAMDFNRFRDLMKDELEKKFRHKPEVIEGNMAAIERAYREVKGE
ncbi:MAG TPA: pyruvate synthase [Firmicutes bacterium]|nr:pyruvate synthase [Bacillota bacterium]